MSKYSTNIFRKEKSIIDSGLVKKVNYYEKKKYTKEKCSMVKIKNFRLLTLLSILFIISTIIFEYLCKNNLNTGENWIIAEDRIDILLKPERKGNGNIIIGFLNKGEKAKIININYSKEFMFYKIRTKDGKYGYIMYGDKFKEIDFMKKKNKDL